MRNVAPQRLNDPSTQAALSQLTTVTTDFRALTTGTDDGVITRFVQDQLEIIFWLRPAQAPGMIFGCLIAAENLRDAQALVVVAGDADKIGALLSRFGEVKVVDPVRNFERVRTIPRNPDAPRELPREAGE